jgi:uncharacterized protein involved in exopolysaccharide biosynthesis
VSPEYSSAGVAQAPLPIEEFSIVELRRGVMQRWLWWVAAPILGAALGAGLAVIWPKTWEATTSFVPEQAISGSSGGLLGAIGSIGSLLGDNGGALSKLNDGPTGEFFADVLTSQELIAATLRSEFPDPASPGTKQSLLAIMQPKGDTPAKQLGTAMRLLKRKTDIEMMRRSGIVKLTVELDDPTLAAAVANRMLVLLDQFNLDRRQRTSAEQRRFAEQRLVTAQREVDSVAKLRQSFLESNRTMSSSPRLLARYDELDRLVQVKEGVLLGLTRTFEESRVSEVKDTPLIAIVDHAMVPDRPIQRPVPWAAAAAAIALLAGLGAAVMAAVRNRVALEARVRESVRTGAVVRAVG